MYLYLYDSFLNDRKYASTLAKIETRLTDLGIGGKIFRLSPLRNISDLVTEEIHNGAKTIVIVGNDKTVAQVLNAAAGFTISVGIIPVGPDNHIASSLGVNGTVEACNILAARKIEKIDVGKANNTYFISNLSVDAGNVTIECENQYSITPSPGDQIQIFNLRPQATGGQGEHFNPKDGVLEVLIAPLVKSMWGFVKNSDKNSSIIPFKKISIKSKDSVPVITDGQKVLKTPVQVEILPRQLTVIVGKSPAF
jgi:diacylglycerol kinase family enzyme